MASIGNLGVFGYVSSSSCLTMLSIMPTYFTSIAANDMTFDPRISPGVSAFAVGRGRFAQGSEAE